MKYVAITEISSASWGDIGDIVNPWQAVVILGVLLVPQVLSYLQSRQATKILKHEIKPNSGATLKDSLNRIEQTQVEHGNKLDSMDCRVSTAEKAIEYFHPHLTGKHKAEEE